MKKSNKTIALPGMIWEKIDAEVEKIKSLNRTMTRSMFCENVIAEYLAGINENKKGENNDIHK